MVAGSSPARGAIFKNGEHRNLYDRLNTIANYPDAGDVIPHTGGCRKIRWTRAGTGKRGGVRVIYTRRLSSGAVVVLVIYAKSAQENIPAHVLRKIAEEMGNATS